MNSINARTFQDGYDEQGRSIPAIINSFDLVTFRRNVAAILREDKPSVANQYADDIAAKFPNEAVAMFQATERLIKSRMKVLGIDPIN